MILLDIVTFLGRLHPLVVHLPIGFLLLGTAFDMLSYLPRYRLLRESCIMIFLLGFVSAVAACVSGYLLSTTGEYDPEILSSHKISGIVLATASGILWLTTLRFQFLRSVFQRTVVTGLCLVVLALLAYTGHQGGSLTHGTEYISLEILMYEERIPPTDPAEALIFEDVVLPVLHRRCEGCHRKGKRKGGLIVTTYEDLMKGGKHGKTVVAGDTAGSELFRRITLDPTDEDFMPADGKTPLTKKETELIRWWIEKANAASGKKMTEIKDSEAMLLAVSVVLRLPGAMAEDSQPGLRTVNPLIPAVTDMNAVANLRKKGFTIRVMLQTPAMLDVTLPAGSIVPMGEVEKDLAAIAKNIVWLNLSGSGFQESDLKVLKEMSNVEKLRLENNPVGDGVAELLADLHHLDAVNLNETRLSDHGLAKLRQHPSLKRIYCWKTAVTETY